MNVKELLLNTGRPLATSNVFSLNFEPTGDFISAVA